MSANTLALRRLGIDIYADPVVFMRRDCHVCRSPAALRRKGRAADVVFEFEEACLRDGRLAK